MIQPLVSSEILSLSGGQEIGGDFFVFAFIIVYLSDTLMVLIECHAISCIPNTMFSQLPFLHLNLTLPHL